jgi:hypothetical protein
MKSRSLAVAALAAVVFAGVASACRSLPPAPPAPPRPAGAAPVSDPAEPALRAEATFGGPAQPVAVAGTALKVNTSGAWQGSGSLTFQDAAPMRFTLTLARMPNANLESLTLSSGTLSLAVGPVSAGSTTRYFDASGRVQDAPERAAYTVTATRWAGGEVDIQVRRAPGAALPKALTVTWSSDVGHGREIKCRG